MIKNVKINFLKILELFEQILKKKVEIASVVVFRVVSSGWSMKM